MVLKFMTSFIPKEWNRVLDSAQEGNYTQTLEYGEVVKQFDKEMRVIRLLTKKNGIPIGLIQGEYRKSKFGIGGKILVRCMGGGAPIICIEDRLEKGKVLKQILNRFEKEAKRKRIIAAQIYWPKRWGLNKIFDELGYIPVETAFNFNIDLKKPISEVWNNFKSSKKKKIKRAIKKKLEIQVAADSNDVKEFYKIHLITSERGKFKPYSFNRIKTYWDIFHPKGKADIFFVIWQRKKIAGALIIVHKDTVYCPVSSSLSEAWEVRPNDFLHWKIIEWAHSAGFSKYNLGRVSTPGLYRWKIEFGAYLDEMINYWKTYMPKTRWLVSFAKKLRL